MAGSVNKVIIIGNLCADPEIRNAGKPICNLRVATSDTWRDKQTGERREKSEFHSVAIFNEQLVKIAQQYLKKGSKVYLEGQLQTRKWQDNSGNDRYTTEIVLQNYNGQLTLLDGRQSDSGEAAPKSKFPGRDSHNEAKRSGFQPDIDLDDSIPFAPEFR